MMNSLSCHTGMPWYFEARTLRRDRKKDVSIRLNFKPDCGDFSKAEGTLGASMKPKVSSAL